MDTKEKTKKKERTFRCGDFESMSEMMSECCSAMPKAEDCCSMMRKFREKERSETNNQGGNRNE